MANHCLLCPFIDEQLKDELRRQMHLTKQDDEDSRQLDKDFRGAPIDLVAVLNCLPISLVDSPELRKFVSVINPEIIIPKRRLFTELLHEKANEAFDSGLNEARNSEQFSITIEFDRWTSGAGEAVLAIVATTRAGKSTLLDLINVTTMHQTNENITNLVHEFLRASKLPPSFMSVFITDEGSNYRGARKILKEKFNDDFLHLNYGAIEFRCMAHFYNLIGASMTKKPSLSGTIEDLIELINIISRSKFIVSHLKARGATKVLHIVATRWYSTCSSIKSVLKIKERIVNLPKTEEFGYSEWKHIVEWQDLENCVI